MALTHPLSSSAASETPDVDMESPPGASVPGTTRTPCVADVIVRGEHRTYKELAHPWTSSTWMPNDEDGQVPVVSKVKRIVLRVQGPKVDDGKL